MLWVIQDIGARPYQEDRYSNHLGFWGNLDYFAVFDGHGDDKVSSFLESHFKDLLKFELDNYFPDLSIEQCLYKAFADLANLLPREMAMNSGSTAVVIIKDKKTLYIANVGDSRVIINNNKKAVPISEDHKPSDKAEYDRIVKLGGRVIIDPYGTARVNGTLAVSRAVGDFYLSPYVSGLPDIYTVKLIKANKYLIAATDGLWDVFDNQELVNLIEAMMENDEDIDSICQKMLTFSRIKGSGDNITILFIML